MGTGRSIPDLIATYSIGDATPYFFEKAGNFHNQILLIFFNVGENDWAANAQSLSKHL